MSGQKNKAFIERVLANYPDCPQREMALQLVRKGHAELAQAWIDALDDLRANGQTTLFSDTTRTGTR